MCNLYEMALDREVKLHLGRVWLPEYQPKHVGPFDTGLFIHSNSSGELEGVLGQWGMIRPGQPGRIEYREVPSKKPGGAPLKTPMLKNNARIETVNKSPAFRDAWKQGRRCLIPATWLQEPNWETGKCIWWRLKRADGLPWMIAGLWSEWTDHETGEVVPNFAMLTFNVNSHPLLTRLHKPEVDKVTKKPLPLELQDKRAEAHIARADIEAWLHGDEETARRLLVAPATAFYDQGDARRTDEALATLASDRNAGQQKLI